ncbi:MAG: hypothetical protein K2G55_06060 [Lachnospiraceae bacterium]|nr:hypothetical protein [Lachnospiraceae bacterium]MDE7200943.1 hypothetical protein [Lachnospiraceae bacterium]
MRRVKVFYLADIRCYFNEEVNDLVGAMPSYAGKIDIFVNMITDSYMKGNEEE